LGLGRGIEWKVENWKNAGERDGRCGISTFPRLQRLLCLLVVPGWAEHTLQKNRAMGAMENHVVRPAPACRKAAGFARCGACLHEANFSALPSEKTNCYGIPMQK
jgi:hypothetical protein